MRGFWKDQWEKAAGESYTYTAGANRDVTLPDSLDDAAVTVRDRDTMEQARIPIDNLVADVRARLGAGF